MSRDVPEPWASAMVRKKFIDPRNGRASMSSLAEAVGTHPSTISAMMYGDRSTKGDIVEAVADALGVDAQLVNRWVGRARTEARPFEPHPDANLLDKDEQDVVNDLIRLLARSKKTVEMQQRAARKGQRPPRAKRASPPED